MVIETIRMKLKEYTGLKVLYWRVKELPNHIAVEAGIRRRLKGKEDKKYSSLRSFKDIHKGQRCFIVATGPSLTMEDLETLSGEITFGMNSITRLYDRTRWRPTYYGIQDHFVYEKMEESILEHYAQAGTAFVADELARYVTLPERFIQFPYNGNYHLYSGSYGKYSARFSADAYGVVYDGYSITCSLIQLAVYMGFRQIYLLGCDCNYPVGQKNHIVESGFVDKNAASNPERMRVGYRAAKEYADAHGIEIINCTRGGMLEVFPRKTMEEVLGG